MQTESPQRKLSRFMWVRSHKYRCALSRCPEGLIIQVMAVASRGRGFDFRSSQVIRTSTHKSAVMQGSAKAKGIGLTSHRPDSNTGLLPAQGLWEVELPRSYDVCWGPRLYLFRIYDVNCLLILLSLFTGLDWRRFTWTRTRQTSYVARRATVEWRPAMTFRRSD